MRLFAKIILLNSLLVALGMAQLFPNLGGQRVGTSTAQFLKIGVGPRAVAMGGAYTAVANDGEALFYNPAGIAQFSQNEAFFSNTRWLVDVQMEYAGLVYHLDGANAFGFAVTYLHTDDMAETTELQPFGTGNYFGYADALISLTYARRMTDKFSFGISAKYLNETIAEISMHGLLFDLGTYYHTGWGSTRFAVAVTNFGGNLEPNGSFDYKNLDNEIITVDKYQDFPPPIIFRIGIAGEVIETEDKQHVLTASLQLNHPNDNAENINIGLEYWWKQIFALRGGYASAKVEEDFSAGFGVKVPLSFADFNLDYSYSNFNRLGYVNRFGIHLKF